MNYRNNLRIYISAVGISVGVAASIALVSLLMGLALVPVAHEIRVVFDVASEANVWTWWNVIVLGTGAYTHLLAAYFRWRFSRRDSLFWILTAIMMAALSLDDLASFHERLNGIGRSFGGGQGFTHFAWIIPGIILGGVLFSIFLVAALRVNGRPRLLLILGSGCFFGAALGIEAVSANVLAEGGHSPLYVLVYHLEEMLEAIGASLMMGAGLADIPPLHYAARE